jgi:hypothetical protein
MDGLGEPAASGDLSAVDVARIAQAFELTPEAVVQDRALLDTWTGTEEDLLAAVSQRHPWDPSVPPFYLYWLRGRLGHPPE